MRAVWNVTSNCSLWVEGWGSGSATTLVQPNAEGQTVSKPGSTKVLRTIVDFLCKGKITSVITNPAKGEVHTVTVFTVKYCKKQVFTAKHHSVAAIHNKVFTV